jgi:hypothetical protein
LEELYRENLCKNPHQIDANTRWALVATHFGIEGDLRPIELYVFHSRLSLTAKLMAEMLE